MNTLKERGGGGGGGEKGGKEGGGGGGGEGQSVDFTQHAHAPRNLPVEYLHLVSQDGGAADAAVHAGCLEHPAGGLKRVTCHTRVTCHIA